MVDQLILETFNELYSQTYDHILKYVVLNVRSSSDVDDIMQDIYLGVYGALSRNRVVNKAYVYGVARHKVKDFYRFKFRHETISLDENSLIETLADDKDLEKLVLEKYDSDKIFAYLKNKNIKIFQIFFLYFKLDYSLGEIAQELNLSQSNVKSLLYRTLKELRGSKYGQ